MTENNIIKLLDDIIARGIELGASDVHLEPREEFVRIRYRVDGLLNDSDPVPKAKQAALISRVKVMVNLDISESRLPQDGRTNIKMGRNDFDIRISTIPTIFGEKVVLRMLERKRTLLSLDELGMTSEDLSLYNRLIHHKNGMVLITGPTGSGKTTTLYSTLKELNSRENNVVTIEDPVEYQIPGINQIQVNYKTGLTFPKVLRAVLRQDPDIILVGEIRDLETARIAVQAALTGHLVFATLHTRDAASSAIRLQEMGIEPYLIKDVVIGAVAQRLVRLHPKGRTAVFEVMEGDSPQKGVKTMRENAKLLIEKGMTNKEEVEKALCLD
jgi:type II secretory ATPase GspE/PulE/Tfp pilus assembly ATPase PilB-like protein